MHESGQVFVFHFDFQKPGTFTRVITLHFHRYHAILEKNTPGRWSKITALGGGEDGEGRGWVCHSLVLPLCPPVTLRVSPSSLCLVSGSGSGVGVGAL